MANPSGPVCNLDCSYCYYLDTDRLYPDTARFRMSKKTLETFIK